MTPPKPVCEFDHPEHGWKWTEVELRWIAARDQQWIELLAGQEPVAYQYRMRPTWGSRGTNWGPWEECSKGKHDHCKKTPVVNDWEHESRALYAHPAPDQAAVMQQAIEALQNCLLYGGGYTSCEQSYLPPTVRVQLDAAIANLKQAMGDQP